LNHNKWSEISLGQQQQAQTCHRQNYSAARQSQINATTENWRFQTIHHTLKTERLIWCIERYHPEVNIKSKNERIPPRCGMKGSSDREMFRKNHGESRWNNWMSSIPTDEEDAGLTKKEMAQFLIAGFSQIST
jgi:hypothetical protein